MIYVSKDNILLSAYPSDVIESIRPFSIGNDLDYGIHNYKYDDLSFRQLKQNLNGFDIEIIQLVDVQENLLSSLRLVLTVSIVLALIIVFFVSKYLTSKSMEPIKKSWENQALFVQDASHELRTPLTIIFSKIEGILKRPNNTVNDEMLNLVIVMKEIRRLRKLVSDLLKLTKEDAIISVNTSNFDVVAMTQDIFEEYRDICDIHSKNLYYQFASDEIYIYSDQEKLRQIIIILLDNAIKYTSVNDSININLKDSSNFIELSISDTGIGIKEEEVSLIFNRFYRASSHREKNQEGSGIGLSIAKMLVSNLNGDIKVESIYDTGSTFKIILPKK